MTPLTVHIVWITGGIGVNLKDDPLLPLFGQPSRVHRFLVEPKREPAAIAEEVACKVIALKEKAECHVVIVIDAFLEPEYDGVRGGIWAPERGEAGTTLDMCPAEALLSVELMWLLLPRIRRHASILVSTDGITVDPSQQYGLDAAFGTGQSAGVYGWDSNSAVLAALSKWAM